MPRDQYDIRVCLGDAGGDGTDAVLAHEFHVNPRRRVGVFQIVDQLCEILDGVDVVVRRRRDEPHPGGGVAHLGHRRIDLVSWKLPALTGFSTLSHLDLNVGAVRQVVTGYPESARGHLFDCAAAPVAVGIVGEPANRLPALTRVRPGAEAIHCDRQGLVCLRRDRAVAHCTGGKPFHYLSSGFDIFDRHRRSHTGLELQQAAQGRHLLTLIVDQSGVLLEDRVLPGAGRVLQLEHCLRVEKMKLALTAPLVFPAHLQFAVRTFVGPIQIGQPVAGRDVGGDVVESDTAQWAAQAGEVLIEHGL